jgi:RHS repeat-associated protein
MGNKVKFIKLAFIWIPFVLFTTLCEAGTEYLAGTIEGEFAVTASGSASYNIPIEVPPGRNGLQPNLALQYNSQQGNGLLGLGWGLAGLSSISRCPKTIAQDGVEIGIQFDASDRFCLQGQRLVSTQGTYGASGTLYTTERESWSQISSLNRLENGPEYFAVTSKDGTLFEYGGTDNSRILLQSNNQTTRVWALNKVTDKNKNTLIVSYKQDRNNGSYRVEEIKYTGYEGNNTAFDRSVQFEYESRPDVLSSYTAGSVISINQRLKKIKTFLTGKLVKEYRLNYSNKLPTQRSQLQQVEECDAKEVCMPPTKFDWHEGSLSFGTDTILNTDRVSFSKENPNSRWFADINHDGLLDLFYRERSTVQYTTLINNGSGFNRDQKWGFNPSRIPQENDSGSQWLSDINGDGLSDIMYIEKDHRNIFVAVNNGDKFNKDSLWGAADKNPYWKGVNSRWLKDMNRDGLPDLVYLANNTLEYHVIVNKGNGFTEDKIWGKSKYLAAWNGINSQWLEDFNGDGLPDILYYNKSSNDFRLLMNTGSGFKEDVKWGSPSRNIFNDGNNSLWVTDFTGEGLLDVVYWSESQKAYYVLKNIGSGFENDTRWKVNDSNLSKVALNQRWLQDLTGDGLPDLVYIQEDKLEYNLFVNKGNGFASKKIVWGKRKSNSPAKQTDFHWFVDINGDSLHDLIYLNENSYHYLINQNGIAQDELLGRALKDAAPDGPTTYRFQDLDGDNILDLIYLDKNGKYHKFNNNLPFPGLVKSIVNGVGQKINIEYRALAQSSLNQSFYHKGRSPKYPEQYFTLPMHVVYSHKVTGGSEDNKNTFSYQHQYEGAKIDIYRGWLGFEKVTLIDVQKNQNSTTLFSQDYPLNGMVKDKMSTEHETGKMLAELNSHSLSERAPKKSKESNVSANITFVNNLPYAITSYKFDNKGNEQLAVKIEAGDKHTQPTYLTHPWVFKDTDSNVVATYMTNDTQDTFHINYRGVNNTGGNIYRIWHEREEQKLYIKGELNLTLETQFTYDNDHKRITMVSHLGDSQQQGDETYICIAYPELTDTWWHDFFPIANKIVSTPESCNGVWNEQWDPKTDLIWQQTSYGNNMNIATEKHWDNSRMEFLTSDYKYDKFGNIVTYHDEMGYKTTLTYDDTYHTFPLAKTMPNGFKTITTFDAKFGNLINQVDPNGIIDFNIPENAINGFGRISQFFTPDPSGELTAMGNTTISSASDGVVQTTLTKNSWTQNAAWTDCSSSGDHCRFSGTRLVRYGSDDRWSVILANELVQCTDTAFSVITEMDNKNKCQYSSDDWNWSRDYIDSLGRHYKTESQGYNDNTMLVSGDVEYNELGLTVKSYLPYYLNISGECPHQTPETTPTCLKVKPHQAYQYDNLNRPELLTDAMGNTSKYEYMEDGKRQVVTLTEDPSQLGQGVWVKWTELYNSKKQIEKRTAPDGSSSFYQYDRLNQLISTTGPLGGVEKREYNSLGQVISVESQETGKVNYKYNKNGLLEQTIDQMQHKINYRYDQLNRPLVKEIYNLATDTEPVQTINHTWGDSESQYNKGRLKKIGSQEVSYLFSYDPAGNHLATETKLVIGNDTGSTFDPTSFITNFKTRPNGQLDQFTYPDGSTISHHYHHNGDINNISFKAIGSMDSEIYASYKSTNSLGLITEVQYKNNTAMFFNYDLGGRLTGSLSADQNSSPSNPLLSFNYSWNGANKILAIKDLLSDSTYGFSQSRSFHDEDNAWYDQRGRIVEALGPYGSIKYERDRAGNLTRQGPRWYEFDENKRHQMTKVKTGCKSYDTATRICTEGVEQATLIYDDNGNLITQHKIINGWEQCAIEGTENKCLLSGHNMVRFGQGTSWVYKGFTGAAACNIAAFDNIDPSPKEEKQCQLSVQGNLTEVWNYSYDAENQLTLVQKNGNKVNRFHYAPDGSRIKKTDYDAQGNEMQSTYYIDSNYELLVNADDGTQVVTKYINGPQGVIAAISAPNSLDEIEDSLITSINGVGIPVEGQTLFFHQGHLGSTNLITGLDGSVLTLMAYKPYGEIDKGHSQGDDNFRPKFTGKEWDAGSELYYFGARYQDPQIGRFITPDPARQFYSPYLYTGGDPLTQIDPDGRFSFGGLVSGIYNVFNVFHPIGHLARKILVPHLDKSLSTGKLGTVKGFFTGFYKEEANTVVGLLNTSAVSLLIPQTRIPQPFEITDNEGFGAGAFELASLFIPGAGEEEAVAGVGRVEARAATRLESKGAKLGEVGDICKFSFVENTQVVARGGAKDIEEIEVGDEVWSYNEVTEKTELKPVSHIFTRIAAGIITLSFGIATVEATPEHPFYVPDKGWVKTVELEVGDAVLQLDSGLEAVTATEIVDGDVRVYNFEVEGNHNYFVGEKELLVHNCTNCGSNPCIVGQSNTYKANKALGKKGDNITPDHIPSNRSNQQYVENKLGRKLTNKEKATLTNNGPTINVNQKDHMNGRTFGGKNKSLFNMDGANKRRMKQAIKLDIKTYQQMNMNQTITQAQMNIYIKNSNAFIDKMSLIDINKPATFNGMFQ